jgi:hypothetical protein
MVSVDIELALVGLVAMLEPAALISSALALALGERPQRTGAWFFLGGDGNPVPRRARLPGMVLPRLPRAGGGTLASTDGPPPAAASSIS